MKKGLSFVAEISGNHNRDLTRARRLIEVAADSGANYVKFQTYKPDTMTLNIKKFSVSRDHKLWGGKLLYELYEEAMTPWDWHTQLFEHAREHGIVPFSTPFDRSAVDFLEDLDCPIYKVASLETGDTDLISYIASTGKPMIISTGATEMQEIEKSVEVALNSGCKDLSLLLCTSSYPALAMDAHINRMQTLRSTFGIPIGLSDHTLGIGVSLAAIALGASIIEKHLTLSRKDEGPDSGFSLEPDEFKTLVQEGKSALESLGSPDWKIQDSEAESRRLRRSLFVYQNVKKGDIATRENIRALRPNLGGPVDKLSEILGKRFKSDYKAGEKATMDIVE